MMESAPKWRRKPDERPGQILQAAFDVFSRKGFRGATMDDVAEAAGITKGTVYLYYPGKEDLFVAMLRHNFQHALDLLPRIDFKPGQDPEALVREVGLQFLETLMSPEVAGTIPLVLAEYRNIPQLKEFYQGELLPGTNLRLAGLLELGMQLGIVRKMDPVIAARCLLGMFFVFVMTQEVLGAKEVTEIRNEDIVETVIAIFFNGVLARETTQ